ncbi:MAG: hypothetical protein RLZ98_1868 [Pseudomonadota bacterium]
MAEAGGSGTINKRMILAVVAIAMFMTNLDSTVIATVIPVMAREFGTNPVHLKLALTSYLLALAIFIPACGWAADRFGARNVFCIAMVVFTLGSIGCALSDSLWELVLARVVQGAGGAMLVPVGRIVVLKSLPRAEMISALALLALPQLIAPVLGPPVGGFIATYSSWQWIFWINVPIAAVLLAFAYAHIPEVRGEGEQTFDWVGFSLIGPGLAAVLAGVSLVGVDLLSPLQIAVMVVLGTILIIQFIRHAVSVPTPLVDVSLLAIPSYRNGMLGAFMFRASIGCATFLVPLVLQEGLGKTAFESGMITLVLGIGAMTMKFVGPPVLKRYGFRQVMIPNAVACAVFAAIPALFVLDPPSYIIMAVLFATSLSRSLQFVATNAVIYADVPDDRIGAATTFFAVVTELSGAVGIAVAAAVMQSYQLMKGTTVLGSDDFVVVFVTVALISASQIIPLSRLAADTGDSLRAETKAA